MTVGDPYITSAELKDVLGITDPSEDALIDRAVRAASRGIENKSGYSTFWNTGTAVARTVTVHRRVVPVRQYGYYKLLLPDGIASSTGMVISGSTGATLIDSIRPDTRPYTELKLLSPPTTDLTITAVWGWPSVPDDIVMAAQLQAQRLYERRKSPGGIAGLADFGLIRIPRLDPDVAAILDNGGYMNPGVG